MQTRSAVHYLARQVAAGPIRIAVIGCGGNGSHMLAGLARLHIALLGCGRSSGLEVTAYDSDRVSRNNVGRQLFALSDIGLPKSQVLIHRLNATYGLRWKAVAEKWSSECLGYRQTAGYAEPTGPHMLISCVDTAKSRREIAQTLQGDNGPRVFYWLDLGNRNGDGQVILGEPDYHWRDPGPVQAASVPFVVAAAYDFNAAPVLATLPRAVRLPTIVEEDPSILDDSIPEDDTPTCSLAESLHKQDLFINQAVSTFALDLLWRLFRSGQIDYRGVYINLVSHVAAPLGIQPQEEHASCDGAKDRKGRVAS